MDKPKILVVDDEEGIRTQLKWALDKDYMTLLAEDADTALSIVEREEPNVVLLDIALSPYQENGNEGMTLLRKFLQHDSLIKVIMVTGNDSRENALKAIDIGAYDFYSKPIKLNEIKSVIKRALHIQNLERENKALQERLAKEQQFEKIVSACEQMEQVFDTIRKVAPTNATVLIQGETGTGKELVAKAIHRNSSRQDKSHVTVNCATIPSELLESELFGHEKGAFTGAYEMRKGKFEMADGGTLFLDEIAELSPELQTKLLRFLQERYLERVGGREPIYLDVRIISATSRDIGAELDKTTFREDLYYRLSVVSIRLPPLRERDDDWEILVNYFLNRFSVEENKNLRGFSDDALKVMKNYNWPGNVRELENMVKRAVIMAQEQFITLADLGLQNINANLNLEEARNKLEQEYIIEALKLSNGNITRAAAEIDISRQTFYDLLKKHDIDAQEYRTR